MPSSPSPKRRETQQPPSIKNMPTRLSRHHQPPSRHPRVPISHDSTLHPYTTQQPPTLKKNRRETEQTTKREWERLRMAYRGGCPGAGGRHGSTKMESFLEKVVRAIGERGRGDGVHGHAHRTIWYWLCFMAEWEWMSSRLFSEKMLLIKLNN